MNYARHSLRALTLWLLSLPFALVKDLKLLTGFALFWVSWLLFGVYEIGYAIEDPFQGTLRLSIICDIIRRDVLGDEMIRRTAFDLDEHNNHKDEEDDDDADELGYNNNNNNNNNNNIQKAGQGTADLESAGDGEEARSIQIGARKDTKKDREISESNDEPRAFE